VEIPAYRPDVEREIDLIEEVGRIYGYDNIPTILPSGEIPPKIEDTLRNIEDIVRETLLSQGLCEVINYSFFNKTDLEKLFITDTDPYNKVVLLRNPLNADQSVLRTTTIPGLLGNVVLNTSNRVENIRIFEIGKVFIHTDPSEQLPDEKTVISGVLTGSKMDVGWTHTQESVDFYDVKGILENTLQTLNTSYEFRRTDEIHFLHPGESATIHIKDEPIGFVGKLHPDVLKAFDINEERIYLFELSLEPVVAHASLRRTFRSLPKFPAVYRDLALIVPASSVKASDIEVVIEEAGQPLLENVVLFDRYVGPQISEGCVGLTYSLRYRSLEKTLTDSEVSEIHQRIIDQLQARLGIRLR
jgi:phenylalanyl-tRNA synthetase beta chain